MTVRRTLFVGALMSMFIVVDFAFIAKGGNHSRSAGGHVQMVICCQVLTQRFVTEVVFEVPPNAVDMIGVVLSVVIFDDERWTLDPVVMPPTGFSAAGPGKMNALDSSLTNFRHLLIE